MIKELKGQTLIRIVVDEKEIEFTTSSGVTYTQYHEQDCCENVWVEDVVGDVNDLLYSPILDAREEISGTRDDSAHESVTWTFYILRTMKGSVTIRWCGESNGYYSESVNMRKTPPKKGFIATHFDDDMFTLQ